MLTLFMGKMKSLMPIPIYNFWNILHEAVENRELIRFILFKTMLRTIRMLLSGVGFPKIVIGSRYISCLRIRLNSMLRNVYGIMYVWRVLIIATSSQRLNYTPPSWLSSTIFKIILISLLVIFALLFNYYVPLIM